jgi:uncharacterized protein (DUF58 family)
MGNRSGSSLEFRDHREYQPGDDLRRIDWSAFARTDKLTVKLYREEVSPHLDLIIDGSRSMALENSVKAPATLTLAALLIQAASNATYSHNTWLVQERCQKVGNGHDRPSVWEGIDFEYRENPFESLTRSRPTWHRQGMRALLSDLLWPGNPQLVLQHLAEGASGVVVVQILATVDIDPSVSGNVRLTDSETDEIYEIFIDASAIRRYRDTLAHHQQNWHLACKQVGATLVTVVAENIINHRDLEALMMAEILVPFKT